MELWWQTLHFILFSTQENKGKEMAMCGLFDGVVLPWIPSLPAGLPRPLIQTIAPFFFPSLFSFFLAQVNQYKVHQPTTKELLSSF
jgi:hypothetical protein